MKLKTAIGIYLLSVLLNATYRLANTAQGDLELIVCDVGQGDAILIQSGKTQVLIDGGPDAAVMRCLGKYMVRFDRVIELVVVTHLDSDHIAGLIPVLSTYQVDKLMIDDETKETDDFKDLKQLVQAKKRQGMESIEPVHGTEVVLGKEQKLRVINIFSESTLQDSGMSDLKSTATSNDRSIGLFLVCDQAKAVLMADIEDRVEQAMVSLKLLDDVNLLKVGHHGSKSSTSEALLRVTRPEISAISAGKNNHFGHPSPQVISRLLEYDSMVLRTDQEGDLVFRCQADRYQLQ